MRKELLLILVVLLVGCADVSEDKQADEATPEAMSDQTMPDDTTDEGSHDGTTEATPPKYYSAEEVVKHNTEEDCWIVYGGKIYDYTDAKMHPNMAKTFYQHCGKLSGFEEGAKSKHSGSSYERVQSFGKFVGILQ